jgi:hypothetical protein
LQYALLLFRVQLSAVTTTLLLLLLVLVLLLLKVSLRSSATASWRCEARLLVCSWRCCCCNVLLLLLSAVQMFERIFILHCASSSAALPPLLQLQHDTDYSYSRYCVIKIDHGSTQSEHDSDCEEILVPSHAVSSVGFLQLKSLVYHRLLLHCVENASM